MVLGSSPVAVTSRRVFPVKNEKSEQHHWILHIRISLGTKFSLKLTILIFWTKFAEKEYFRLKTKKVNIPIEFCIFDLVYVSSLTLNWPLWFFGANFPKKSISGRKQKSEHHHWILHIRIRLGIKFHFKLTILNFWTKFVQKEYFRSKTKWSEHYHWVLHIRISLSTKFRLQMAIFIFWTKFSKKGISCRKRKR